jgi:hypothetical protein
VIVEWSGMGIEIERRIFLSILRQRSGMSAQRFWRASRVPDDYYVPIHLAETPPHILCAKTP